MKKNEGDTLKLRPSIRWDYSWIKGTWLELIAGVERDNNLDGRIDSITPYLCSMGFSG